MLSSWANRKMGLMAFVQSLLEGIHGVEKGKVHILLTFTSPHTLPIAA